MKPAATREEVLKEHQANTRRLCHAFRAVFGRQGDANRTPQQKAVWEALEELCFQNRSTFMGTPGPKDPISAAINEGYRMCFLQIREFVHMEYAERPAPPEVLK